MTCLFVYSRSVVTEKKLNEYLLELVFATELTLKSVVDNMLHKTYTSFITYFQTFGEANNCGHSEKSTDRRSERQTDWEEGTSAVSVKTGRSDQLTPAPEGSGLKDPVFCVSGKNPH